MCSEYKQVTLLISKEGELIHCNWGHAHLNFTFVINFSLNCDKRYSLKESQPLYVCKINRDYILYIYIKKKKNQTNYNVLCGPKTLYCLLVLREFYNRVIKPSEKKGL